MEASLHQLQSSGQEQVRKKLLEKVEFLLTDPNLPEDYLAQLLGNHKHILRIAGTTRSTVFLDCLQSRIDLIRRTHDYNFINIDMDKADVAQLDKNHQTIHRAFVTLCGAHYSTLQAICCDPETFKVNMQKSALSKSPEVHDVWKAAASLDISDSLIHCYSNGTGAKCRMILRMWEAVRGFRPTTVRSELETKHHATLFKLCSDHTDDENVRLCDLSGLNIPRRQWRAMIRQKPFSKIQCIQDIRDAALKCNRLNDFDFIAETAKALKFIGGRAVKALIDEVQFSKNTTCMFHPSCQWKEDSVNKPWKEFVKHVEIAHSQEGPLRLALRFDSRQFAVDNDPLLRLNPRDLLLHQKDNLSSFFFCPLCFVTFQTFDTLSLHIVEVHSIAGTSEGSEVNASDVFSSHLAGTREPLDILQLHYCRNLYIFPNATTATHPFVQICPPADRLDDRIKYFDALVKRKKMVTSTCLVCNYECPNYEVAREHMLVVHGELFDCRQSQCTAECMGSNICNEKFNSFRKHFKHYVDKHFKALAPYICPFCGRRFNEEKKFKVHLWQTSRLMCCPEPKCTEHFDVVGDLLSHINNKHRPNERNPYHPRTIRLCAHWRPLLSKLLYTPDPLLDEQALSATPSHQSRAVATVQSTVYSLQSTKVEINLFVTSDGDTELKPFFKGPCALWALSAKKDKLLSTEYCRDSICDATTGANGVASLYIPNDCDGPDKQRQIHLVVLGMPVAALIRDEGKFSFEQLTQEALSNNSYTKRWPAHQIAISEFFTVNEQSWTVKFSLNRLKPIVAQPMNVSLNPILVAVIDSLTHSVHRELSNSLCATTPLSNEQLEDTLRKLKLNEETIKTTIDVYNPNVAFENTDDEISHGTKVAGLVLVGANSIPNKIPQRRLEIRPYNVACYYTDGRKFEIKPGVRMALYEAQIYRAVAEGCAIINLSLGFTHKSAAEEAAIVFARRNGCVIISASGNDSGDRTGRFPALLKGVVAVGSVGLQMPCRRSSDEYRPSDNIHAIAKSSNMFDSSEKNGDFPNIFLYANGMQSFSSITIKGKGEAVCRSIYGLDQGTSMATALVSGVAARALCSDTSDLMRTNGSMFRVVKNFLTKNYESELKQLGFAYRKTAEGTWLRR